MSGLNASSTNEEIIDVIKTMIGLGADDELIPDDVPSFVQQETNADNTWMLIAGFLVFFMHAGFTMLEAGSVRHKNAVNILFKNVGTISIGALCYYLVGWGIAYGSDNAVEGGSFPFIGSGQYALDGVETSGKAGFFFQMMFAATAATIVSGAVAGRINLVAYFLIAVYLTSFVYPVVSHWVWATNAWLNAFYSADEDQLFEDSRLFCGAIDFAGSGVVHMTGGVAAMVFAAVLGPRLGRFDSDGAAVAIPPHNIAMQALGVFILWFGWYGFNCGSTLVMDGDVAGKVAVTTTLSPAAAVVTAIIYCKLVEKSWNIGTVLNAALGGLVSITSGAASTDAWMAVVIGAIGAFVYIGSSKLMLKLKIDDPVDAVAVHGFCGAWGVLASGIFFDLAAVSVGYSNYPDSGEGPCSQGEQFATQVVLVLVIIAWVAVTCVPVAIGMKVAGLLRVSAEDEEAGLDLSEHGGSKILSTSVTPADV